MSNKSVLDTFIDSIVDQTASLYKGYLSQYPDRLATFRDNFEDLLLFHIMALFDTRRVGIGEYDKKGKVGNCIVVALETVGISLRDVSSLFDDDYFDVDYNIINTVKWRIIHNEDKYLKTDITTFVSNLQHDEKYMNDTGALLDLAFVVSDRFSYYNKDRKHKSFHDELLLMWEQKKATMDEDSLSFKVLKAVIEDDPLAHYSLAERRALKSLCAFMEKVESEGSSAITLREYWGMKRDFRIAKMVSPQKMSIFEEEYNKAIRTCNSKRKNGRVITLKEN